ncbi:hypothetical protein [Asticcacaulis taihuensis]|uniref:hypothetical protein n=1 Tax=Asticcacaulis taihuensis TaxID=260084 RepID=UPI0026EF6A48|nr:hypothetical protein [Asticcacaulis taihuensis]
MQDVDICNLALGMCAADAIASLTENTPMGLFCAQQYPQKRDFLMGAHRWVFATKIQPLSRIDDSGLIADQKPAAFAFVKPTDIQGLVYSYRDQAALVGARQLSVVEFDGKFWCGEAAVWVEYTAKKDESTWPAWFIELVKTAFAADVARRLQNNSLAQSFQQQAFGTPSEGGEGGLYGQARIIDGRASPTRQLFGFDDGDLVNVRYSDGCVAGSGTFIDFN